MKNFDGLSVSERQALVSSLRAGDYNLLLGAGISLDSENLNGEKLPTGNGLKEILCGVVGVNTNVSLQRVFQVLTPDQIDSEVTKKFINCKPGPSVNWIPKFLWKRVFTLNIDDCLSHSYNQPNSLQKIEFHHFRDAYSERKSLDSVPVVHLHGYAPEADKGYVFDRNAYAAIMADNNAWMTVLADIMPCEPFFIIGTSLDEVDVSYYLAKRSSDTRRLDRGPSFLIEPFPDVLTQSECEKHGLHLWEGTALEFFEALDNLCPNRKTAYDLISDDYLSIFEEDTDENLLLSFNESFSVVPRNVPMSGDGRTFLKGSPPSWEDLSSNRDIGRAFLKRMHATLKAMSKRELPERVLIHLDAAGSGKSTVLRRLAYNMAAEGVSCLFSNTDNSFDPIMISRALDKIKHPIVIFVDNISEQAAQVASVLRLTKNKNVVFVGSERSYKRKHLESTIQISYIKIIDGLDSNTSEVLQLIDSYDQRGLLSVNRSEISKQDKLRTLSGDVFAVVSCKLLNDMSPISKIAESLYMEANNKCRLRYIAVSISNFCVSSGLKYEILLNVADRSKIEEQFETVHPLAISFIDSKNEYVSPLNVFMSDRIVERAAFEDILAVYKRLSLSLAPRVNRSTIKSRTPEARLAGRLLDYDDVVSKYLKGHELELYNAVRKEWQWNSRYWEQVSLCKIAKFYANGDTELLTEAVQNARHAVSIEKHPHPMTTLGKVLLAQSVARSDLCYISFNEAVEVLSDAINIESQRSRISVHAYITLFRGVLLFLSKGGEVDDKQAVLIRNFIHSAMSSFAYDSEISRTTQEIKAYI